MGNRNALIFLFLIESNIELIIGMNSQKIQENFQPFGTKKPTRKKDKKHKALTMDKTIIKDVFLVESTFSLLTIVLLPSMELGVTSSFEFGQLSLRF